MKVKILSRNFDDYLRETKKDIHKTPRNYDPKMHPLEGPREYIRALNAVKLERVFAKPFVGSLDGHRDSISCLNKHPTKLAYFISGSYDGEIRIWNITTRKSIRTVIGHDGIVKGVCVNPNKNYFLSCGDDKIIKQWTFEDTNGEDIENPLNTIIGKSSYSGMDHHWRNDAFSTCGHRVDLWDIERFEPVRSYEETYTSSCVKFNPIETNLLLATASDRSLILYDIRHPHRIRKTILKMNSNSVAWNPLEAFNFTAANEDYNLYTFDIRKMVAPAIIHKNHIAAVIDIDYCPTGKEFVSGSYDKTIRIFNSNSGHSRDVYHTRRMQRISCVKWSSDCRYILSASEEMNIRLWKANASEKLGILRPREKEALNYSSALKEKFAHYPQVSRIAKHRHVPRHVYTATKEHQIIEKSQKKRLANKRAHSKPGSVPFVSEKNKKVITEIE